MDVPKSLTPKNGGSKSNGWIDQDTTAQNYALTLTEECLDCTVRLMLLSGILAKVNKPNKYILISHKHKLIP